MNLQVVQQLSKKPPSQLNHKYERATIAQSDLCGFTKLAANRRPEEVHWFIGAKTVGNISAKFKTYTNFVV